MRTYPLQAVGVSASARRRTILENIDCSLRSGTVTALVGPNGAGKTTLLHLFAGLTAPQSGRVLIHDTDVRTIRAKSRARAIAFVEQQPHADPDLTAMELVVLGRTPYLPLLGSAGDADTQIALESLDRVDASHLAGRRFRELSGGERQRVFLAKALAQEPEILILDEPTNHLDIAAQLQTLRLLRSLASDGLTILAALHDLTLAASHVDCVALLSEGRLLHIGSPEDTLTVDLIRQAYGVESQITRQADGKTLLITFPPLAV